MTTNGKSTDQTVAVTKSYPASLQATLLQPADVQQLVTEFGAAVAIDENNVIVGAPNTSFLKAEGRVFIHNTAGVLTRVIENPEPTLAGRFGETVTISAGRVLVGADEINGSSTLYYLFDISSGTLLSSLRAQNSYISTPSISGDLIVIPLPDRKEVAVYSASTGDLLRSIEDPTVTIYSTKFGRSAVIGGNIIAAGIPGYVENGEGAARIYLFDAMTGTLLQTLTQPAGSSYESFGDVLSISGSQLLVGDYYATVPFGSQTVSQGGRILVFDLPTGTLLRTINNPEPTQDAYFGRSIGVSSTRAIVGVGHSAVQKSFAYDIATGTLIDAIEHPNNVHPPMAISDGRAVLGSPRYSLGVDSGDLGAAFVYDLTTKTLNSTLFNPTPASADHLGHSVATSESSVVVGVPDNDQLGSSSGRVMVYQARTGAKLFTLDPTLSASARFGTSVATSGNYVAVGAPGYDVGKLGGSVLIYDATAGNLVRTISNPSSTYDLFGETVALSGNTLVVGAPYSDIGGVDSGVAYIFDVTTGVQRAIINNPSPAANEYFGMALAVSESAIVAGVEWDSSSGPGSGEAYIFSVSSGLLIDKLTNPTPEQHDRFGISVAADGDYVVVGASGDSTQALRTGQAYLYRVGESEPIRVINNPFPTEYQTFGSAVGLSNNVLVIGNKNSQSNKGRTYLFDVRTGALSSVLENPTPELGDNFGGAVGISGNTIVVGAEYDDTQNTDQGAAYLFELSSAPQDLEISTSYIQENNSANAVIGTLTTYSQALNPVPYSYQLVAGGGDTDNAKFLITANQLILKSIADFEQQRAYNILVRSTDERGRSLDKKLTINVVNQLEGSSAADQFVLTISTTSVSLTLAQNGGAPTNQGTYSLTPQLLQEGFQGVGLGADDTVRIVGSISNDIVAISSSGIVVNSLSIAPGIAPKIIVDGSGGTDTYQIDGSATIASLSLFDLSGIDTIDFSSSTKGVSLDLSRTTPQTVTSELSITLQPNAFENLYGGTGDDVLTGNSVSNTIKGNNGNDILNGKGGSDTLAGGLGDDTYQMLTASSLETDELIEGLNAGGDTIDFSAITTSVTASLAVKTAQSVHTNRKVTLNSDSTFENIVGGSANDTLTGNAQNNRITGGGGSDTQSGVAGNDTYVMTPATLPETDSLSELINAGTDTIDFGLITSNVIVNLGTSLAQQTDAKRSIRLNLNNTFENLNGGAGKDLLTGNASANVINGNGGNDTLNGAAGNDLIAGGPGNDVYLMTAATTAETDTLTEAANAGIDSLDFSAITTSVTLNLSSSSSQSVHTNRTLKLNLESTFENASGGTANDSLTGNNEANVLVGNGGNDSLNGAGGNDILIGGTGGDTLNGAAGEDILIAGTTSFDSLFVQLNSLRIVWTGTASYSSRVASLRAGTGAPVVALKTGTTVFSDALSVDTLVGGTESDWFLAALNDLFTNRTISEELDLL